MKKPDDLRAWLTKAIPALKRSPELLQMFVDKGTIVAYGGHGLSYEQRYTLTLQLLDFGGDPEHIMAPVIVWLAINQPELLGNPRQQTEGVRFEVDILDGGKVDLQIELLLTERVKVSPSGQGRFDAAILPEPDFPPGQHPLPIGTGPDGFRRLYLDGELVAEWDAP